MADINWVAAIVAGAVSGLGLGFLWYGPVFGKAWMKASGIMPPTPGTPPQRSMMVPVVGSLILSILAAIVAAMFIGTVSPMSGAARGFHIGLFFAAASLGINYLWEGKSFTHWLINGGYMTAHFTLIGLILGLWH